MEVGEECRRSSSSRALISTQIPPVFRRLYSAAHIRIEYD